MITRAFLRPFLSVFVPLLFVLCPLELSYGAFLAMQTRVYKLLINTSRLLFNKIVKVSD